MGHCLERIASAYRQFRRVDRPEDAPGFSKVVSAVDIANSRFSLSPGRYVGSGEADDEGEESVDERIPKLLAKLEDDFTQSHTLEKRVRAALEGISL